MAMMFMVYDVQGLNKHVVLSWLLLCLQSPTKRAVSQHSWQQHRQQCASAAAAAKDLWQRQYSSPACVA
jgi:hypothetical protein